MKKLFSWVSIAALALTVGCSEDQTTDQLISEQGLLRATTEAPTRTTLDGENVVWSANDKLAVLTSGAPETIEEYTLMSEAGLTTGNFSGKPLTGTGDAYAFYPYDAVTGFAQGIFNFTLPATQQFTANSFANNMMPMVSRSAATNELMFKNLMGVVKFQVGGDQAVSSLTVTTAGEKIAGAASVAMNYNGVPELIMDASGTNSITLTKVYTLLAGAPVAFYIALPAGEYAAGMKFELKDNNDNVIWSITTSKPLTINRSKVAALEPVYTKNFPDKEFRKHLTNSYGLVLTPDKTDIDITNAENISKFGSILEIICPNMQITSLKGIEFFTVLTDLNCSNNQLTTLDLTKNVKLKILYCNNNKLSSLNVTKNTALELLSVYTNSLTSLDVTKNTALKTLYCTENGLTTLDLTKNTALEIFDCNGNQLTTLDLSGHAALTTLRCLNNQLMALNLGGCTALKTLYCNSNSLTTLSVITNTALITLDCDTNQLTSLDLTNNTALETLYIYDNRISALDVSANAKITILQCGGQTTNGITAQTLKLWCNAMQLTNTSFVTGANNQNVTKALKE